MVVKMLCLNLMLLLHSFILHLISTVVFCTCLSSNISWGLGVFYPANIRTSKIQHLCQFGRTWYSDALLLICWNY